jgi:hypothetical protein
MRGDDALLARRAEREVERREEEQVEECRRHDVTCDRTEIPPGGVAGDVNPAGR